MHSFLFACIGITLSIPQPTPLDRTAALESIKRAENWDGHSRGHAGEWGPWQMTPKVWHRYSKHNLYTATAVDLYTAASAHLRFLGAQLEHAGIKPTAFWLGLAWNSGEAGAEAAFRTHVTVQMKFDYAERVEALYEASTARH